MQIRLLVSYVTRVTIYIIFLHAMPLNANDYTDKNYFLLFRPCHFEETRKLWNDICYTVLWKLCMADLNNVQN